MRPGGGAGGDRGDVLPQRIVLPVPVVVFYRVRPVRVRGEDLAVVQVPLPRKVRPDPLPDREHRQRGRRGQVGRVRVVDLERGRGGRRLPRAPARDRGDMLRKRVVLPVPVVVLYRVRPVRVHGKDFSVVEVPLSRKVRPDPLADDEGGWWRVGRAGGLPPRFSTAVDGLNFQRCTLLLFDFPPGLSRPVDGLDFQRRALLLFDFPPCLSRPVDCLDFQRRALLLTEVVVVQRGFDRGGAGGLPPRFSTAVDGLNFQRCTLLLFDFPPGLSRPVDGLDFQRRALLLFDFPPCLSRPVDGLDFQCRALLPFDFPPGLSRPVDGLNFQRRALLLFDVFSGLSRPVHGLNFQGGRRLVFRHRHEPNAFTLIQTDCATHSKERKTQTQNNAS